MISFRGYGTVNCGRGVMSASPPPLKKSMLFMDLGAQQQRLHSVISLLSSVPSRILSSTRMCLWPKLGGGGSEEGLNGPLIPCTSSRQMCGHLAVCVHI